MGLSSSYWFELVFRVWFPSQSVPGLFQIGCLPVLPAKDLQEGQNLEKMTPFLALSVS